MSQSAIAPGNAGLVATTPPGGSSRRKPAAIRRFRLGDVPAAYLLLAPVLILFAFSVIYPLADTVRLSLFDIKGLGKPKFVGLGNYLALFNDPDFRRVIVTTFTWTVMSTVLSVGIGWMLAIVCAFSPQATLIPRMVIFAAFGISEAVTGFMWAGIYRPDAGGMLNGILGFVGLGQFAHPWLGDSQTALWCLIVAYSWAQVGLPLIVIFAAAQAVPRSTIEAAYMDGARPLAIMWHIIAPLAMPGVRVAIFINLLGSLRAFDMIYILTAGGPVRSTETVGYFMYRESFTQFKLGYGAAATMILLAAVLLVSIPAILQRTKEAR
ncbi:carbohydrate ABC transporter permease [uncultured Devosia sp.]|uniref:carbohydrate ABC transporter permease n=1 Tax=uncultured Devosia sp. TaxID=211434 RepID=UPI0035CBA53B